MIESKIAEGLARRGVPPVAIEGILRGMRAESGLNPGINEIAPVVPGSRGGFGLNQWTGPRRKQFEEFARSQGKPLDDLDTQLDFTVWELQNTEKAAGGALYGAADADTAASIYETKFLRPGIPHGGRGKASGPVNALASPQAPAQQQNVLAQKPNYQWNTFQLDPNQFRMT